MRPLILLTPHTAPAGAEMPDPVVSLARHYFNAVLDAGGVPLALPLTADASVIDAAVERSDGVILTGGDDIAPERYWPGAPPELVASCFCAEPLRDEMELAVVASALRWRKPVLGICRGHQLFNVALGGTLFVDLPAQRPGPVNHNRMDLRLEKAHAAAVAPGTLFESVVGLSEIGVNTTHHQAIDRLAPQLRIAAVALDGVIEAAELAPGAEDLLPWFLSVQFHPERLYARHPEHAAIFKAFVEACSQP
jgi:putative glutamine amidotransferase